MSRTHTLHNHTHTHTHMTHLLDKTTINDGGHTGNRQRSLGDIGREYNLNVRKKIPVSIQALICKSRPMGVAIHREREIHTTTSKGQKFTLRTPFAVGSNTLICCSAGSAPNSGRTIIGAHDEGLTCVGSVAVCGTG